MKYLILVTLYLLYFFSDRDEQSLIKEAYSITYEELLIGYPELTESSFLFLPQPIENKYYTNLKPQGYESLMQLFLQENKVESDLTHLIPETFNSLAHQALRKKLLSKSSNPNTFWSTISQEPSLFGTVQMTKPVIKNNKAFVILAFQWGPRNGFHQWFVFRKEANEWHLEKKKITIEY